MGIFADELILLGKTILQSGNKNENNLTQLFLWLPHIVKNNPVGNLNGSGKSQLILLFFATLKPWLWFLWLHKKSTKSIINFG